MSPLLLMAQAISQYMALFCCALFAGGSTYICLVEDPATSDAGPELAGLYALTAHPRPAIFLGSTAVVAALTGILHAMAGGSAWWLVGGLVQAIAALVYLFMVIPEARRFAGLTAAAQQADMGRTTARLKVLHAAVSLGGLAALFIFISRT